MADVKCNVENLAEAISEVLEQYEAGITQGVKKQVSKTAKELKESIERDSPENPNMPGAKYSKSWKKSVTHEDSFSKEETVHSNQPGLTHLLENGHALRQGGRAKARPHIAPNAERAVRDHEKRCKEVIENGC